MKIFLVVLAMMTSVNSFAQYGFDISKDKENGSTVYRGVISFDDLKEQLSFDWFEKGAKDYKPDTTSLKYLQKNLPGYSITVFMGTWCSDSHDLVPKLYKVL